MDQYSEKLRRETDWHQEPGFQKGHFLNSHLFYSPEREDFSGRYCRAELARYMGEVLSRNKVAAPHILVAPLGLGRDLPYIGPLAARIAGIDISAPAVEAISHPKLEKHVGDIKKMTMFKDGQFDAILMSQFFHHFLGFGFDEFLLEARRVLKPGGHLFSMEPTILHPFALVSWCGKKLFGNISGCVEDESPFYPGRLTSAMKRCGFRDVRFAALSYSHQRMPIALARVIHVVGRPVQRIAPFKYFGWGCVFYGRRP